MTVVTVVTVGTVVTVVTIVTVVTVVTLVTVVTKNLSQKKFIGRCRMASTLTYDCRKVNGGVPIVLCIFVDLLYPIAWSLNIVR